jgi:uncharacterized ferredoxin-like protein
MTVVFEEAIRSEVLEEVAQKMLIAARTAPKGRGIDNTVLALARGDAIKKISDKMKEMGTRYQLGSFLRDAENILSSPVLVLLGTKINSYGLSLCGMCGFKNCEEKKEHQNVPCAFNTGDLGIAIGSAVSIAMDHRVDNRIMYSAGQAAIALGLLGKEVRIAYGIPLSATSKNPFFDRK